jgi:hypothetical protein
MPKMAKKCALLYIFLFYGTLSCYLISMLKVPSVCKKHSYVPFVGSATLGARWQFLIWNARIRNSNSANCTQGMLRAEPVFVNFTEPRNRF